MATVLDFEKPIMEIQEKIEELKKIQRQAKQRKYGKKSYYQKQGRM